MKRIAFAVLLLASTAIAADARITRIRIDRVEPFAAGTAFGDSGAYERVIGVAAGELDPADPRNAVIAGLDRAPRNAGGMVEYETDLFLLRPVDPARGNHHLLFEVTNRGNKLLGTSLNQVLLPGPSLNDPKTADDAGDGFLFRLGYTLAWTGWDPDIAPTDARMAMRVPKLAGVTAEIRDEFLSGTRGPAMEKFRLSYAAAAPFAGVLTVKRRAADTPRALGPDAWRFADNRTVELLPPGTRPEPGSIYELTYQATNPWVSGIGFAATRDVAAFLRSGQEGDPARGITHAIGYGVSLSGRYLRDFIAQGFNQDESAHKVFDGVLTHVGGAGRVFLNTLFAEIGRTRTQHEDHAMPEEWHPFATAATVDPVTGKPAALLRNDGFDPLLIEANTDAEYWQKGASLLGTNPEGTADLTLAPTTRVFLIAGTQHTGRIGASDARGPCVNLRNPHNPAPALRALLVDLDAWVTSGTAPPESRVPHIADHTLVTAEQLHFPKLPGFVPPGGADSIDAHNSLSGDWVHPQAGPSPYRPLIPAVDADGNPTGGLRLPDIAVPVATHTGFNFYTDPYPAGEMCDRDGSFLKLAPDAAAREATADPRPSLVERYRTQAEFVAKVRTEAQRLVDARLLLPEDADRYFVWARGIKIE